MKRFLAHLWNRGARKNAGDVPWLQAAAATLTLAIAGAANMSSALSAWLSPLPALAFGLKCVLPLLQLFAAVHVIGATMTRTTRRAGINGGEEVAEYYTYPEPVRLVAKLALPVLALLAIHELVRVAPRYARGEWEEGYACREDTRQSLAGAKIEVRDAYGNALGASRSVGDDGYFRVELPAFSFRQKTVAIELPSCTAPPLPLTTDPRVERCPAAADGAIQPDGQPMRAAYYPFRCP